MKRLNPLLFTILLGSCVIPSLGARRRAAEGVDPFAEPQPAGGGVAAAPAAAAAAAESLPSEGELA